MLPARPPPPPQQPGAPEAAAHRRPKAPHKSPRCGWRRDTAGGGEGRPRCPAAPPPARRRAWGGGGRPRAALGGAPGTYHGVRVIILLHKISPTKGARRRDTASVPPAAHARRRGERRGKRGLEGPAMFRPASRPAGAGRQQASSQCAGGGDRPESSLKKVRKGVAVLPAALLGALRCYRALPASSCPA